MIFSGLFTPLVLNTCQLQNRSSLFKADNQATQTIYYRTLIEDVFEAKVLVLKSNYC